MAPGDIFISPASVEVVVLVKGEDPTRTMTDRRYTLTVDSYGLANIEQYPGKLSHDNRSTDPNFIADREAWRDAVNELLDAEILTWKAIGPEDSELFADEEFQKILQPALDGLAERQHWQPED
jgi:hypothetical protein